MVLLHQLPSLIDIYCLVFGICVGSFLNVLALRSLEEKSLISPRSHCPKCQHQLGLPDLIPILSYLMLGGKCRYCKAAISWHYPFIEFFTGLITVLLVNYFGFTVFTLGMY